MVTPKVITPPTWEPIVWSDVLEHSRALPADQAYCEKLIKAVRQHLEHRTGKAFIEQALEIVLDSWPSDGVIVLPRATPLVSVTSVKYYDSANVETTVAATEYDLDTYSTPGRIAPGYGKTWPSFTPRTLNPIMIQYVAGWVEPSPATGYPDEDVKHAMRLLVGHFYEHREAVVVGENTTIEAKQMELAMAHLLAHHEEPAF